MAIFQHGGRSRRNDYSYRGVARENSIELSPRREIPRRLSPVDLIVISINQRLSCSFLLISSHTFPRRDPRRGRAMEFESVDLRDASSHPAPNHLPGGVPRFASSRRCIFSLSPFLRAPLRKIHIADQIEIIHYLNSVATTVRDLLVDVAPDSPL